MIHVMSKPALGVPCSCLANMMSPDSECMSITGNAFEDSSAASERGQWNILGLNLCPPRWSHAP